LKALRNRDFYTTTPIEFPDATRPAVLRARNRRVTDVPAGTDRESASAESVTYVSGMNCYLCLRNRP
jgi:hypothetical protein